MNDVTTYQQTVPATLQAPQAAGVELSTVTTQATQNTVDLVAWANELGAAKAIADAVSSTSFVPDTFKNKPVEAATAILYGKSIGLDPLAALSNVFIIYGRPAIYARTMVALAQGAGVEFERVEATEQQVTVRARRKGSPTWQSFTWSISRATKAGYTKNDKYKTDPIGMLTAKAFTEAVRVVAPAVLMGVSIGEEVELGDYDDTPTPAKAVTAGAKKVQRKAPAKQAPAPAAPPAPVAEPEADTETGEITEAPAEVKYVSKVDQAKISAGLEELNITSPADKRDVVKDWTGLADLKGVNGLTHEQAQHVLARIEREKQVMFGGEEPQA